MPDGILQLNRDRSRELSQLNVSKCRRNWIEIGTEVPRGCGRRSLGCCIAGLHFHFDGAFLRVPGAAVLFIVPRPARNHESRGNAHDDDDHLLASSYIPLIVHGASRSLAFLPVALLPRQQWVVTIAARQIRGIILI